MSFREALASAKRARGLPDLGESPTRAVRRATGPLSPRRTRRGSGKIPATDYRASLFGADRSPAVVTEKAAAKGKVPMLKKVSGGVKKVAGETTKKQAQSSGRRIPYPLVAPLPGEVATWDDYYIWLAARYKARDNYARRWRKFGVRLPPLSDEWDAPIPEPLDDGPAPAQPPVIKRLKIPHYWTFELHALSSEEQERYDLPLL